MDIFTEADSSNLFNLSPGNEIPQELKTPMLDTTIKIQVGSPQETLTPFRGLLEVPVNPSFALSPTSSTFSAEISIPPTSPPPRTQSLKRSVMDEASGEALCMLHRQISQLERDKEALQDNVDISHLHDQLHKKDAEFDKLHEEIKSRNDAECVLGDGIQEAREQMDYLTTNSTDKNALADAVQRISELEHINSEHATAIKTADHNLDTAHQESAELCNTMKDLQNDNEALKSKLEALETKLLNMEEEWSEGEKQCIELESELQQATEEHETHITSVTAELTFANENVSRLESNIKECDASISTLTTTLLTCTDKAESLRKELTTLKIKHSCTFSSQTRALQDLQT
ncbi:hypothetical protein BDR03DRAFT_1014074 [Suillus americanus]|nr:hypothetical protein BDR03DRAFT_1014074 [Suillus americanus]